MKSKILLVATLSLALSASIIPIATQAQSSVGTGGSGSSYSFTTIALPFSTLAGGTTTNLANGWQTITSYTNITKAWDPNNLVFTSTTNVTSVTNTSFADFNALRSRYVVLQWEFNTSDTTSTSNAIITYVKGATKNFDTNQVYSITNKANGPGLSAQNGAIDMGGYGYGRVISLQWTDSNADHVLTNGGMGSQGLVFTTKQGASQ